jgi:D-alanyl-lipoteichoic acid acyltransferase DltB (MBOAT superfamily)
VIFHSLDFAVFFSLFLAVYWFLGRRAQNVLLLVGSYFFYGYVHPWFVILLAASTLADYSLALAMQRFVDKRKLFMIASVSVNLSLLAFFKYFGFFVDNVWSLLHRLGIEASRPSLNVILPVGISFYTFQTLSYTIDVYRGRIKPRKNLLDFATFLSLFPQLVAGPIERATHVLPQVERPRHWDPDAARSALLLMCWGLFKKIVIADNVALVSNKIFSLDQPSFSLVWVGTLAFACQIYADFSAYSDIARGTARLLGFELMKNFDHPYVSQTPGEFWRRWHISLSSWFRDYVYIPLGGNRGPRWKHFRNIALTFVLSGFWHGPSWNFVLWGAFHALLLIGYQLLEGVAPFLIRARSLAIPRVIVLFALTNIGWLMFRETDSTRLFSYFTLSPFAESAAERLAAQHLLTLTLLYSLPLVADSLLSVLGVYEKARDSARWVALEGAVVVLLILGMGGLYSDTPSDFIYFQF